MTTIYLIRHSKTLKPNYLISSDNLQIQNEKQVLSVDGERIAKQKFENEKKLYSPKVQEMMEQFNGRIIE